MDFKPNEQYRDKFKRKLINAQFKINYEDSSVLLAEETDKNKVLLVRYWNRKPTIKEINKLKRLKVDRVRLVECIVYPEKNNGRFGFVCAEKGMFR